jgi:thiosulfate dehydrogenase [quinone] large subunit
MNTIKTVFTKPAYTGLFWLVLRVFVGYEFLSAGIEKIESGKWLGAGGGAAISGFLKGGLAKATGAHPEVQDWYVGLVNNVFLPNAAIFANMVAIGETLVGIALIFGVLTKFAAFWGAVMNFTFLAAGTSSSSPQMLVIEIAMIFAGAGVAYYGIDFVLMPFAKKVLGIGKPIAQYEPATPGAQPIRGSLPTPRPVH